MGLGIVFTLLGLLMAAVWFFLPFAVFGSKPRMDALLKEAKLANERLQILIDLQRSQARPVSTPEATSL